MTTKVSEVVIDALEDLIVQSEEADIEPTEARAAIRVLNDMMAAWDSDGVTLGYTEVSNMGDIMTVAPGAIKGIKANLAVDLAPKYSVAITPGMIKKASDGYMTCVKIAITAPTSFFPDTLPQGSGNTYPTGFHSDAFYPDQQDVILTESGGRIALEDDTEEES